MAIAYQQVELAAEQLLQSCETPQEAIRRSQNI